MNIEQAKAIPIVEILAKLEMKPVRETETDAMYFSPWREERTASLHVSKEQNLWYDHGEGLGGDAYQLAVELLKRRGYNHTHQDVSRWFRNMHLDPALPVPRDPVGEKKSKWKLLNVMPLKNLALIRYLNDRGINAELASQYVKEIDVKKKCSLTKIFALGFRNEDGGFELRNRQFKSCVAPKTVTFVRADKPKADSVMLFEGFMDFLTYLTIQKGKLPSDIIVLNSVACVDHAMRYVRNYGYKVLYSWMHNDKAGEAAKQRLNEFIKCEPGLTHKPLNWLYKKHKDLNECYMAMLKLPPVS